MVNHLFFLIASYTITGVALICLFAIILLRGRYLRQAIARLEKQGVRRRSSATISRSGHDNA